MIEPKAIDHTTLFVRSIERSKAYYQRLFAVDCKVREDSPGTLVVESPHIHFFLVEDPEAPADFVAKQHLSLQVDDLDQAMEILADRGVTGTSAGEVTFFRHNNYRWCEWRDPDGIRLECVQTTP